MCSVFQPAVDSIRRPPVSHILCFGMASLALWRGHTKRNWRKKKSKHLLSFLLQLCPQIQWDCACISGGQCVKNCWALKSILKIKHLRICTCAQKCSDGLGMENLSCEFRFPTLIQISFVHQTWMQTSVPIIFRCDFKSQGRNARTDMVLSFSI